MSHKSRDPAYCLANYCPKHGRCLHACRRPAITGQTWFVPAQTEQECYDFLPLQDGTQVFPGNTDKDDEA